MLYTMQYPRLYVLYLTESSVHRLLGINWNKLTLQLKQTSPYRHIPDMSQQLYYPRRLCRHIERLMAEMVVWRGARQQIDSVGR